MLKGDFIPQINGTIVMSINLEKSIIIEEKTSSWGFVLSYAEFQECEKFLSYRICNKKAKEINLSSENECVLNLMFRNSTENYRIELLKIKHDAWFETGQSNVWEYATPNELKVDIFHGDNHTSLTIRGTGQMRLTPPLVW